MARKTTVTEGQESLFTDDLTVSEVLSDPTESVDFLYADGLAEKVRSLEPSYGPAGSYVDVAERSKLLITALEAYSARNSRKGFAKASFIMPHSKEIWARYQEDMPHVLRGASHNKNAYNRLAAVAFWRATGFSALRGTKLMRDGLINPLAEDLYDDFYFEYSHKKRLDERRKYRKALMKLIPVETQELEEKVA